MTRDGAPSDQVWIRGERLLLRPFRPAEIDDEWQAMVNADPMTIAELPDEKAFRARLGRSGRMADGWIDLAIDLNGSCIGRIQTFVPMDPANRAMRAVFDRVGWHQVGAFTEFDRQWVMYRITRDEWQARMRRERAGS
jgi:hypothetical protein